MLRLRSEVQKGDDVLGHLRSRSGRAVLVLDEADRMIETGHFAELDNILRLTLRENR